MYTHTYTCLGGGKGRQTPKNDSAIKKRLSYQKNDSAIKKRLIYLMTSPTPTFLKTNSLLPVGTRPHPLTSPPFLKKRLRFGIF